MAEEQDGTTVAVTSKGQATIPKEFREKLQISTPGRVRFVETEEGEITVRPVKPPSEIRGDLASEDDEEQSASEMLREERERDKQHTEDMQGLSESDG